MRVAAGDLRKRIATYYMDVAHEGELRVDLPSGSYVPNFQRRRPSPADNAVEPALPESGFTHNAEVFAEESQNPSPSQRSRRPVIVLTSFVIAVSAIAVSFWFHQRLYGPLDAFWAPLIQESSSTLFCAGSVEAMARQQHHAADDENGDAYRSMRFEEPNDPLALMNLSAFLGERHHAYSMLTATRTNLSDLRRQPTVFVGGLNNEWTRGF